MITETGFDMNWAPLTSLKNGTSKFTESTSTALRHYKIWDEKLNFNCFSVLKNSEYLETSSQI